MKEIEELFEYLSQFNVDGHMISPAYGYTAVKETNPTGAAEIFMTREDIRAKFQEAEKLLYEILDERKKKRFLQRMDLDFAYEVPGVARFRCNFLRQHNGIGLDCFATLQNRAGAG